MAQPTNTFDSYDAAGIREDLSDMIYDISPEETPFYSKCKKVKATNTNHEWQTDALRTALSNKHIEGDDTTAEARTATTRLGNYTQIFKNAVIVPDTDEGLNKAGRAKEISYQSLKIAKEQKLDIEHDLLYNNAKVAGNASTARELAGVPSWLNTNVDLNDGTAATGDGTDVLTPGTLQALSQANFDSVMQSCWESGGKPDTVYLSAAHMDVALGFTGNNNQRSTIKAESEQVIKHMAVYVTPWGTVEFVPSREIRGVGNALADDNYVFICQSDMWKVAVLRGTKTTALAKTGDNTKRQVVTELTLQACNEASSGMVADLTATGA